MLIVVVILEGISYGWLWLLPRISSFHAPRTTAIFRDQTRRFEEILNRPADARDEIDPDLGWRYRAGFSRNGDRLNSQGLRSEREYTPVADSAIVRAAAFGDSFVYGNEVATKDAWASFVERLYPNVEVLNYGVGGYGDDQAYLRFARDGKTFQPPIVLLGFMPDDLRRLTNRYRRFIDDRESPWTKPRFRLTAEGELQLIPAPIRDTADIRRLLVDPKAALAFGENDQWFEPAVYRNPVYDYSATVRLLTSLSVRVYNKVFDANRLFNGDDFNPRSEAFALQVAITKQFVTEARANKQIPLVIMVPDEMNVRRARTGGRMVYASLTDSLRARGIDVFDLAPEFARQGTDADVPGWFAPGGHYSPRGNEIVARAVGREILARAGALK